MPWLLLILLCLSLAACPAPAPSTIVSRVVDGDTLVVVTDGVEERIRLLDVDAPEQDQPHGSEATAWVADRLSVGERIELVGDETDRYGRRLSHVRHDGGRDLATGLMFEGLAWVYHRSTRPDLEALQVVAERERLGLWSDPRRMYPGDWRKLSREERIPLRQPMDK